MSQGAGHRFFFVFLFKKQTLNPKEFGKRCPFQPAIWVRGQQTGRFATEDFEQLMETKSSKSQKWKLENPGWGRNNECGNCTLFTLFFEQLSKCQRGPGDGGGSSMKVSGVLRTFGPERWKGGRWYSCRFVVFSSCGSRMVVSIGVPAKSCACQKVAVF